MSGSVGSILSRSSVVENAGNRWNRVAIAFRSKFIFTSGLYRLHSEFPTSVDVGPCSPMSAVIQAGRAWSKMWGIRWNRVGQLTAFNSYFNFHFGGRHFEFGSRPTSGNVSSVVCKSDLCQNLETGTKVKNSKVAE